MPQGAIAKLERANRVTVVVPVHEFDLNREWDPRVSRFLNPASYSRQLPFCIPSDDSGR